MLPTWQPEAASIYHLKNKEAIQPKTSAIRTVFYLPQRAAHDFYTDVLDVVTDPTNLCPIFTTQKRGLSEEKANTHMEKDEPE